MPVTCSCSSAPTSFDQLLLDFVARSASVGRGEPSGPVADGNAVMTPSAPSRARRPRRALDRGGDGRDRRPAARPTRSARPRCAAARRRRVRSRCSSPAARSQHVDAVVFSGGSAFGLAAADGVMRALAQHGRGFPTRGGPVPIVPGAAIFDLVAADGERPGPDEGVAALDDRGRRRRPGRDRPGRRRAAARPSASGTAPTTP